MSDILVFDIETIPSKRKLNDIEIAELEKRISKRKEDADKNLIMATSPFFGDIVCIGLYKIVQDKGASKALIGTEQEILTEFWRIIRNFNGTFVSFNGLGFDAPYIIKKSMFHNILPTNNNFMDLKRFSRFPHFDVRLVMNDFDAYASGSLEFFCSFLNIPSSKEGKIKADKVAEAYDNGMIKDIADYCIRDVVATFDIYKILKNYTRN